MENINSLSKEDRYDLITGKILSMIYEGHMKNGDKMFSENQMAKRLGVSRAHIREVYSALGILGILESRRGEGTFFKTTNNAVLFKVIMLMLYNDSVTTDNIMELRKILEVGIAEKAATSRTEKDIKDLRRCIDAMEKCDDGSILSELDNELHSIIGHSCGNYLLMSLSNIISGLVIKSIQEHWNYIITDKSRATKKKTFEQHKELVESIINKKPYIAKVIAQEHLEFVEESLDRYKREFGKKADGTENK